MLTSANQFYSTPITVTSYYPVSLTISKKEPFFSIKSGGNFIIEKWLLKQSFPVTTSSKFTSVNEHSFYKEITLSVNASQITSVITFLKKASFFCYEQLIDISAIDNYKKELRFEVVYQLLSVSHTKRISLSLFIGEGSGVNSVVPLYSSAGWYERETWDIFGVYFYNHPDLRRILTDYGFKGHPLRKDFPVTGFLEVRYNTNIKSISYEKVSLAQAFREVNVGKF